MSLRVGLAEDATDVTTLHGLERYNGCCSGGRVRGRETVKTVKGAGNRSHTQLKLGVNERGWVLAVMFLFLVSFAFQGKAEDTLYWNTNTSKVTADIRNTDLFHVLSGISAATG